MEDFIGCVLAMAGITYAMALVSLMVILYYARCELYNFKCTCSAFYSIYNHVYDFI